MIAKSGRTLTFSMFAKVRVRGRAQHRLYAALQAVPDATGKAGNVRWNFEKFLIGRDGEPIIRFRTPVTPDSPALIAAVERALANPPGPARAA